MKPSRIRRNFLAPFRQLRWRLTLAFTLVTLASLLMVFWWVFLGTFIDLNRANPQASLPEISAKYFATLIPTTLPWLPLLVLLALLVSAVFGFITTRWLESRLNRLREATDAWSEGDLSVRIRDDIQDEITRFGQQLNQMAADMETLLSSRQELAALEERNQLARDLHDSVKQQLAAAVLQIGAAQSLLAHDPSAARAAVDRAEELALQAQGELTNIILELRPAALHEKGLVGAMQSYIDQWSPQTGVRAVFVPHELRPLSYNTELTIYRVLQEALANVARHSLASQVEISLTSGPAVELCVQDDGRGFDPALVRPHGFGLKSMRDRLEALNGSLEISTVPGEGTRITAHLPVVASTEEKN